MYQNKYYLINQKLSKVIYAIIFFALLCLIGIFIILNIPVKRILFTEGFVVIEDSKYYIKIYVDDKNLKKINCHNVIIDDQKEKLNYFIVKEAYTVNNNLNIYHEVLLKVNLTKKQKIENFKLNILFVQEESTFLKELINYVKWGLYERID